MKKFTYLAILVIASIGSNAIAQTISTIGIGDFEYLVESKAANDKTTLETLESVSVQIYKDLISTRKFKVLDKIQLTKQLSAENFSADGYYDGRYQGEKYHLTGLDYILTGKITEFGVFDKPSSPDNSKVALVEFDFRLISTSFGSKDISSTATAQLAVTDDGDSESVLDQLIQNMSKEVLAKILSQEFPLRVMKVSKEGIITLNYGRGLLKPGDTVKVFAKQKKNKADPTNRRVVGTLQIVNTGPKFSTAQILDGSKKITRGLKAEIL